MEIVIKKLDRSSAQEQVNLFNKVFNKNASLDAWLHKHYYFSTGDSGVFGAYDKDKLVGINGFIPMSFKYNSISITGLQSGDTAIDQAYRGKGIFSIIISTAQDYYRQKDVDVIIGFPNDNSYPGFIKLRWEEIARIQSMFIPCNLSNSIKAITNISFPSMINNLDFIFWRKIKSNISDKLRFILKNGNDPNCIGLNKLLMGEDDTIVYSVNPNILKWKLHGYPYDYYSVSDSKNISASFIVRKSKIKSILNVAEVLAIFMSDGIACNESSFINAFSYLLLHLKIKYDFIKILKPQNKEIEKMYKRIGFCNVIRPSNVPFIIKILTEDVNKKKILLNRTLWNLTGLEPDTTINLEV